MERGKAIPLPPDEGRRASREEEDSTFQLEKVEVFSQNERRQDFLERLHIPSGKASSRTTLETAELPALILPQIINLIPSPYKTMS